MIIQIRNYIKNSSSTYNSSVGPSVRIQCNISKSLYLNQEQKKSETICEFLSSARENITILISNFS